MIERWQFAHAEDINAEKHYPWSKTILILKNRTHIVSVPCDQIENSGSWIKIDDDNDSKSI